MEWSGVGAAQEPEYRGDGDAHAHLIEYRKEEKKKRKGSRSLAVPDRVPLVSRMRYFSIAAMLVVPAGHRARRVLRAALVLRNDAILLDFNFM